MTATPGVQELRIELLEFVERSSLAPTGRKVVMDIAVALALAAHVEACGDALHHDVDKPAVRRCGDGWYCSQAEAIRSMG